MADAVSTTEEPQQRGSGGSGSRKRSGAVSPIREEEMVQDEADVRRAPKRPRRPDAAKGRGMLGMLNSTLSAIKRESEASSSAAAKRLEIEAKASAKLATAERRMAQTRQLEKLIWQAHALAEQIAATEAQRKTMRALKRRMASFLWTQSSPSRVHAGSATTAGAFAMHIPTTRRAPHHAAHDDYHDDDYPVYFLPSRTLPEQEDLLNEQEDAVDDEIDRLDDDWQQRKHTLLADLDRIKASIRDTMISEQTSPN